MFRQIILALRSMWSQCSFSAKLMTTLKLVMHNNINKIPVLQWEVQNRLLTIRMWSKQKDYRIKEFTNENPVLLRMEYCVNRH